MAEKTKLTKWRIKPKYINKLRRKGVYEHAFMVVDEEAVDLFGSSGEKATPMPSGPPMYKTWRGITDADIDWLMEECTGDYSKMFELAQKPAAKKAIPGLPK